jgi:predicted transcriptional regulator
MEEILTIRVPKGTRRRLEKLARAQRVTLSQYVRRAIETEELLGSLERARASLIPSARAQRIFTDDDVFSRIS